MSRKILFFAPLVAGLAWGVGSAHAATTDAGTVYRELKDADPELSGKAQPENLTLPRKKVIVPLGDKEDLLVEVKSVQLLGDLPAGIDPQQISAILMKPKAIKRMSELKALAQEIEDFVHEAGFPVFRVIVPDQEIFNGRVRMLVFNGKIDKIIHVLPTKHRIDDEVIQAYFTDLIKSGGFKRLDFERTMLLLNDLPGIKVRLILNPGAQPGLIDGDVEVIEGSMAKPQLNFDNYGTTSTGKNRATGLLKLNDLTGIGDRLTLMVNASVLPVYAAMVEYKRPVGTSGLTVSANALLSDFSITDPTTNIGTKGSSQSLELGASYPLWLVFGKNVYLDGSVAARAFSTQIDVTAPQKKDIVVGKIGFRGSAIDTFADGFSATNFGNVYFYNGQVSPQSGYVVNDKQNYTKYTYSLVRNQAIPKGFNLLLSLNGLYSNSVLDSSEKMALGGGTAVRAYDPTVIYSNKAQIYTAELGRDLGDLGKFGVIKSSVFYDHGISWSDDVYGHINTLKGAGIMLGLQKWGMFDLRLTYARRVGTSTIGTLQDDRSNTGRVWFNLMTFF